MIEQLEKIIVLKILCITNDFYPQLCRTIYPKT